MSWIPTILPPSYSSNKFAQISILGTVSTSIVFLMIIIVLVIYQTLADKTALGNNLASKDRKHE